MSEDHFSAPGVDLYCGDCRDLLPIEADAVVTDSPYGLGIANNPER